MLIYKFTKSCMVKSFEFVWFHYILILYYSTLFKINEYDTSAPFKSSNLHLPSVTHILIDDIVVLLIGLNVILCGSNVKE